MSGLGQERLDLPRVAEHARVEDLDRDRPAELLVAGVEDAAEPAGAQQRQDGVSAESLGERPGRRDLRRDAPGMLEGVDHLAAGRVAVAAQGRGRVRRVFGRTRLEGLPREGVGDRGGPVGPAPEVIAGGRGLAPRGPELDLDRQQLAEQPLAQRRGDGLEELIDRRIAAVPPPRLEPLAGGDDAGEPGDFERRGILGLQRVHRASPPGLPRPCDPVRSRVPPHRPADPHTAAATTS